MRCPRRHRVRLHDAQCGSDSPCNYFFEHTGRQDFTFCTRCLLSGVVRLGYLTYPSGRHHLFIGGIAVLKTHLDLVMSAFKTGTCCHSGGKAAPPRAPGGQLEGAGAGANQLENRNIATTTGTEKCRQCRSRTARWCRMETRCVGNLIASCSEHVFVRAKLRRITLAHFEFL